MVFSGVSSLNCPKFINILLENLFEREITHVFYKDNSVKISQLKNIRNRI